MKTAIFSSVVATASAGGSLALTWSDCGTASTHAKTTDVKPASLALGTETAITGTGDLDKTVSGGTYDMELKAGGGIIDSHFTGNNCDQKDFDLPLGLGTLSWDGLSCPLAAASGVSIGFKTKLAASLPPALATSTIDLKAVDQDAEDVLCVNLKLAAELEEPKVIGGTLDLTWKDCGDASTHGKVAGLDTDTITLGQDVTVTGSGTVDEDVTSGAVKVSFTAGGGAVKQDFDGDVCAAKEFDLPLGLGQINWKGLACPVSAGAVKVPVGVQLAAAIPASLAVADVNLAATGASADDKLLCLALHTSAAVLEEPKVNGGTLDLTWKDCGDASTHGKVAGLDTDTITLGQDVTVTGSGTVDEDVTSGAVKVSFTAGGGAVKQTFDGDVCAAKEFDLPLGLGQINWKGLACPVSAGEVKVPVGVQLAAAIPATLAVADVNLAATGASADDKLLCLALHTAPASTIMV